MDDTEVHVTESHTVNVPVDAQPVSVDTLPVEETTEWMRQVVATLLAKEIPDVRWHRIPNGVAADCKDRRVVVVIQQNVLYVERLLRGGSLSCTTTFGVTHSFRAGAIADRVEVFLRTGEIQNYS